MTGDFNDDRQDACLEMLCENERVVYLEKSLPKNIHGTYCHNGDWIHFDHFLCSNMGDSKLEIKSVEVIAPFWIREKDTQGPRRFYKGIQTTGGYSDHYPILLKLSFKRKVVE